MPKKKKKVKLQGLLERLYLDFCQANAGPVFCMGSNASKHSPGSCSRLDIIGLLHGSWTRRRKVRLPSVVLLWKAVAHGMTLPQPSLGSKEFSTLHMDHPLWGHKWEKGWRSASCTVLVNLPQEQPRMQLQGKCLKDLHFSVGVSSQINHLAFQRCGLFKAISL